MIIKDISFVGFVKLNILLIFIPRVLSKALHSISPSPRAMIESLRTEGQFPTLEAPEQTPYIPPSTEETLIAFALVAVTSAITVYVLAKIVHFLAQNTKIGDIYIGKTRS